MKRIAVLTFALACLLVDSSSAFAASPKPCDFMNAQAAASIFGASVDAGRAEDLDMGSQQCVFDHNDPAAPGQIAFGLIDINAMAASMGANSTAILPIIKQSATGQKFETIPSLGEWNLYSWDGQIGYSLTVIYRGKVLSIHSSGSKNPNLKTAVVQAMRQALQKL